MGKKISNSVRQVDSRTKCNQQKLAYSLKKIDNRGMYRSNTQIQTLKYIQPYHIQKKVLYIQENMCRVTKFQSIKVKWTPMSSPNLKPDHWPYHWSPFIFLSIPNSLLSSLDVETTLNLGIFFLLHLFLLYSLSTDTHVLK